MENVGVGIASRDIDRQGYVCICMMGRIWGNMGWGRREQGERRVAWEDGRRENVRVRYELGGFKNNGRGMIYT